MHSIGDKEAVLRLANYDSANYVDSTTGLGDTPLHQACKQGWLDIVELLIEKYGCDPDVTDNHLHQSPLHYACQYGHIDVVKYLINERGCNPLLKDKNRLEPLDHALNNDHTDIANYICKHCISSAVMMKADRLETTLNLVRIIIQDMYNPDLYWKTADDDSVLQLAYQSESIISRIPSTASLQWLNDTTLDLLRVIKPNWKTADGDTLLQLVCQSESCISHISSALLLSWLSDTAVDLLVPNWKTADGETIVQILCQYESCIPSRELLKGLNDTTLDLIITPNWKTVDGIHKLLCRSELCISHISSPVLLNWLKDTTLDLERIIVPTWKTADGDTFLQLVCQSESCISRVSSTVLLKWLNHTTVDLVIPNWKTADGDTIIQMVCKYKSHICCVPARPLLKWLNETTLDLIITPNWKTVDGNVIPHLLCLSEVCVSHISSPVLLKWLSDTTLDLERIVVPNSKTIEGDSLLQLVCQSESCMSRISSSVLLKWLSNTTLDLMRIIKPSLKTANGDTLLQLICQSKSHIPHVFLSVLSRWLICFRNVALDWKTDDGDTFLHLACHSKFEHWKTESAIIKYLLNEAKINPNSKNRSGLTPLQMTMDLVVIEMLINAGASISSISSAIALDWLKPFQVLQRDKQIKLFKLLTNKNPDVKTTDGYTCLHLACKLCMHPDVIHYLLSEVKCFPNFKSTSGLTALQLASDPLVIKKLVYKGAILDSNVVLKIASAKSISHFMAVELLRVCTKQSTWDPDYRDSDGNTVLHLACRVNKLSVIKFLLSLSRINPNSINSKGQTPIMLTHNPKVIAQLMKHGASITSQQASILLAAVDDMKEMEIVELLQLSSQMGTWDPNSMNRDGNTALHLACKANKPAIVTSLLSEAHCNPNIKNKEGITPLQLATSPDIILILCEHHHIVIFSETVKEWLDNTELIDDNTMKKIVELVAHNHKFKTEGASTLLHLICKDTFRDKIELIHYLLNEDDCDPNCLDGNGQTPLQLTSDSRIMTKLVQHGAKMTSDVLCKVVSAGNISEYVACELITLSIRKRTMAWNPNDVLNSDGDTSLHAACKANRPEIVKILLSQTDCNPNIVNKAGLLPLEVTTNPVIILKLCEHDQITVNSQLVMEWLNNTAVIKNITMKNIFELLVSNSKLKTNDGSTLLHLACININDISRDQMGLIHYLISEAHCDPNCLDSKGQTPLQLASRHKVMKKLVQYGAKMTTDIVFKVLLTIPKHLATELLTLSIRKGTMSWNPDDLNNEGDSILHVACKINRPSIVKWLLTEAKCNPNQRSVWQELPLEMTTNLEVITMLIKHGAKLTPELVLKLESVEAIPKHTLIEFMSMSGNPNDRNSDGNTALHLACKADRPATVNLLLSKAHCSPNVKNNSGEVPLEMTTNLEIIKDLIRYGAQTYTMYQSCKRALGTSEPIKPPVKVFVVGNPSVGKSTLTAALKKELNFMTRIFTSKKVTKVDKKTVGIVPHDLESDKYGRIIVYDFAGHREFYSGHAALLQATVQSTPPIFLLVVNLCEEENEMIQTILYWISFLENQCFLVSCKPHVIIVGSHADSLKSRGKNPQNKVRVIVNSLHAKYFINLKFIRFVAMDCQYHESAGMSDLRRWLVRSCNELRIQVPIPFNAHCFYVYLIERFIDSPAVTISAIHEQIKSHGQQLPQTKEEFFPKDLFGLYRICIELHDRGHILFLKDKMAAENSYVVIDQKSLLSEVSGTVFAPEDFKQYKQLATSKGVVSLSRIKECFPGKDLCILVGFLNHLEFCHEVSDQAICQLLSEQYPQTLNYERYYLFPALISVTANDSLWKTTSHFNYSFGWSLECTNLEQFFGSRFLQVLLLRLAFSFALNSSCESEDEHFGIH